MQFEGMHRLAPDNEDALFMLMRGWTGYGYAFAMDDYEAAFLAEDDAAAAYHQKRAKLALDRGISYGLELIGKKADGFEAASSKDADTINAWLKKNFTDKEDGENLFWLGSAWLARVNLLKDERQYVAKLFVGVALLERSRELYPEYMSWGATATLGAYHARSPDGRARRGEEAPRHRPREDAAQGARRPAQLREVRVREGRPARSTRRC